MRIFWSLTLAVFTTGACTPETNRSCVICWLLERHGNTPKWKSQHAGIFSAYQARTSVHASHIDWRGQELVLEGVARAKYDSDCCFL